jgi:hypothetical protein
MNNSRKQLQYLRIAMSLIRSGERAKSAEREHILSVLETLERRLEEAMAREVNNGR